MTKRLTITHSLLWAAAILAAASLHAPTLLWLLVLPLLATMALLAGSRVVPPATDTVEPC